MIQKVITTLLIVVVVGCTQYRGDTILIEAESFSELGGWVIDQQSIEQMGSSYILAHGLGKPVKSAKTTIEIKNPGKYKLWVRTKDWVALWEAKGSPGKFKVFINGKEIPEVFGTKGTDWQWQNGGVINIPKGECEIELKDMTGFDGRCDAIVLSQDMSYTPSNDPSQLKKFREDILGLSDNAEIKGKYDLVVVGGGMAGCCAAVTASRLGCKVALIQNRPVLGGNNSSEVRVGLSGLIHQKPYPRLGDVVDQIGSIGHWNLWEAKRDPNSERSKKILEIIAKNPEKREHNAGPKSNYGDDKKLQVIKAEKNIDLFLNTHIFDATTKNGAILSVKGRNIKNNTEVIFRSKMFVDCTGDGTLGALSGANYRIGRESRTETQEERAPIKSDKMVMGTSIQWYARKENKEVKFPECPWAVQFNENSCFYGNKGDWDWETGAMRDQVLEIERIRDHALRVTYGNWDYIKNRGKEKARFANHKLSWVAYIGGKRESRRLIGDIVLKEQDILRKKEYSDASFTTTWGIDLHYPVKNKHLDIEPFRSRADIKEIEPYAVPYRCLYSKNINNLFMAGRNISVTHAALGTVRVMRTTGMMGEVVGMAAALCRENQVLPRAIYEDHFSKLQSLMTVGAGDAKKSIETLRSLSK